MQLPALAIKQPDMGRALLTAAQLRSADTQNRLAEYKLAQMQTLQGLRSRVLSDAGTGAGGGGTGAGGMNTSAFRQLMVVAPGEAKKIADTVSSLDKSQREKQKWHSKMAAAMAYQIESAPEEQRPMMYPQMLAQARKMGLDVSGLPPQYDPKAMQGLLMTNAAAADYLDMESKADRPITEIADPNSPTGTRYVRRPDAIGQPGKPGSGLDVQFNPDGTVKSITTGRKAGASSLSNKTANDIQEKQFNAQESLSRLNAIAETFRPEFQTFESRGKAWWTALKEKAGGNLGNVSPDERKQLSDYADYKRNAIENINLYIKELSGAAVSAQEATRLRAGLPDPGDGIFDGDSPTEFQSKMRSTIRSARRAIARYNYALKAGLDPQNTGVSLDGIDKIMRNRATEIQTQIQTDNPGIGADELRQQVRDQVMQEFGLK